MKKTGIVLVLIITAVACRSEKKNEAITNPQNQKKWNYRTKKKE